MTIYPPPGAGVALAQAYIELDTLPVEEQARRAYTPTGPSIAELERRLRERRRREAGSAA